MAAEAKRGGPATLAAADVDPDDTPCPISTSTPKAHSGPRGELLFEGCNFEYPSRPDVQVLKSLQLRVQPGERVALLGSSGSGKPTVIQPQPATLTLILTPNPNPNPTSTPTLNLNPNPQLLTLTRQVHGDEAHPTLLRAYRGARAPGRRAARQYEQRRAALPGGVGVTHCNSLYLPCNYATMCYSDSTYSLRNHVLL